jgi:hypothetical protein
MRLECWDVNADELSALASRPRVNDVVLRVHGGDPVVLLAAHGPDWPGEWGIWLEASEGYPAALIARDVKTLSHLMHLGAVVVDASSNAAQHAEVVRRLLSDDTVDLSNDVATLSGAVNRPAPPRPVRVWHVTDEGLCRDAEVLRAVKGRDEILYVDDAG